MIRRPPRSTLFPTRRSSDLQLALAGVADHGQAQRVWRMQLAAGDRKSTRLNSSHSSSSYAVFCLKKKKNNHVGSRTTRTTNKTVLQVKIKRERLSHVYTSQ